MYTRRLFIASSKANINVARTVAGRLEGDGCGNVTIWDEGVFGLNEATLNQLLTVVREFDFAILIWAADDITQSGSQSMLSPRDNVIFESGLFMGAMGKDCVFLLCDDSVPLKRPTDFAGITLALYDGARIRDNDAPAAVREACDRIARVILQPKFPEIEGEWTSRYALSAVPGHAEMIDTVEVKAARGGVCISKCKAGDDPYCSYGRVYNNQIIGEWRAAAGNGFNEGLFVLTLSPKANVMYGYCTARDENGAAAFVTWVLAKKGFLSDTQISENLLWGEKALRNSTIRLPLPKEK